MVIGRDNIAATVNTLVLAYAGASLPRLLLFARAVRNLTDVAAGELVAVEIVRTLVGSTHLVAAVPVTTGLAAWVVTRGRPIGAHPATPSPHTEPHPAHAPPGPPPQLNSFLLLTIVPIPLALVVSRIHPTK